MKIRKLVNSENFIIVKAMELNTTRSFTMQEAQFDNSNLCNKLRNGVLFVTRCEIVKRGEAEFNNTSCDKKTQFRNVFHTTFYALPLRNVNFLHANIHFISFKISKYHSSFF